MTLFIAAPQTPAGVLTELHNTGQQPMPALVKAVEAADVAGLDTAFDAAFAAAFPPAFDLAFPPALEEAFPVIATALAGTGLHVQSSGALLTTRIRPRLVQEWDYFIGGTNLSGAIGKLGWTLAGNGTPTATRGNASFSANVGSRIQIQTSAVIADRACLLLGDTETRQILRPENLNILQACMTNTLTTRRIFFGLSDNFAAVPTAMVNCLGFYFDSAVSPNWQLLTRASSVGAPAITATPPGSAASELVTLMRLADDNYEFYSGNTLIGSILAGVADNVAMGLGFRVETLAASAASINLGYFGLQAIGASSLDDDNFLQG